MSRKFVAKRGWLPLTFRVYKNTPTGPVTIVEVWHGGLKLARHIAKYLNTEDNASEYDLPPTSPAASYCSDDTES